MRLLLLEVKVCHRAVRAGRRLVTAGGNATTGRTMKAESSPRVETPWKTISRDSLISFIRSSQWEFSSPPLLSDHGNNRNNTKNIKTAANHWTKKRNRQTVKDVISKPFLYEAEWSLFIQETVHCTVKHFIIIDYYGLLLSWHFFTVKSTDIFKIWNKPTVIKSFYRNILEKVLQYLLW